MPLLDTSLTDFQALMDEALTTFKKTCVISYPPKLASCNNCIYDDIGKKSSNRWKDGGPIPFYHGACPMCQGAGCSNIIVTANIDVTVNYSFSDVIRLVQERLPSDIKFPTGIIGIRAWATDKAKIESADYLTIDSINYRRFTNPLDVFSIVQSRYCYTVLERIM